MKVWHLLGFEEKLIQIFIIIGVDASKVPIPCIDLLVSRTLLWYVYKFELIGVWLLFCREEGSEGSV